MADTVPAALRLADVNIWKCATKAAQLQTVKPIMAYWCMLCASEAPRYLATF